MATIMHYTLKKFIDTYVALTAMVFLAYSPINKAQGQSETQLNGRQLAFSRGLSNLSGRAINLSQLNDHVLPASNALQNDLDRSGHPDRESFRKNISNPLKNIGHLVNQLKNCGLETQNDLISSQILNALYGGECTIENQTQNLKVQNLLNSLNQVSKNFNQAEKNQLKAQFHQAIVKQMRANTISMYLKVQSTYKQALASSPTKAIANLYDKAGVSLPGEVLLDKELKENIKEMASQQPSSDEERQYNLNRLFSNTQKDFADLFFAREDRQQIQPAVQALDDFEYDTWITRPDEQAKPPLAVPPLPGLGRGAGSYGPSLFSIPPSVDYDLQPEASEFNPFNTPLDVGTLNTYFNPHKVHGVFDRPELIVADTGLVSFPSLETASQKTYTPNMLIRKALMQRYNLEIEGMPEDNELVELTSPSLVLIQNAFEEMAPGQGAVLSKQFIEKMDIYYGYDPAKAIQPVKTVSPRDVHRATTDALNRVEFVDDRGLKAPFRRYFLTKLNQVNQLLEQSQINLHNNFLTWDHDIIDRDSLARGRQEVERGVLEKAFNNFSKSSLDLLKKIENELATANPDDAITNALLHNPGVVGQVLAKNPKFAQLACELKGLAVQKSGSNFWSNFFIASGIVIAVGATLLTAGAAAGAAVGMISLATMGSTMMAAGAIGWLGTAITGASVVHHQEKERQLRDQIEWARLFKATSNSVTDEQLQLLMNKAEQHLTMAQMGIEDLKLEAGLSALFFGAGAAFKGLNNVRKIAMLRRASRSVEEAKKVIEELGQTQRRLAQTAKRGDEIGEQFSIGQVLENAAIKDPALRLSRAKDYIGDLSRQQQTRLIQVHESVNSPVFGHTPQQVIAKYRQLRKDDVFSAEQAQALMRSGLAGSTDEFLEVAIKAGAKIESLLEKTQRSLQQFSSSLAGQRDGLESFYKLQNELNKMADFPLWNKIESIVTKTDPSKVLQSLDDFAEESARRIKSLSAKIHAKHQEIMAKRSQPAPSSPTIPQEVHNLKEYFQTPVGKSLGQNSTRTSLVNNNARVYKAKSDIREYGDKIKKGDCFYLDRSHGDHIEVFAADGNFKFVMMLDGSINEQKTKAGIGRKISCP